MSVVFTTQEALCQYSTEQTVLTSIPSSVAIEKKASNTEGSIKPETGAINGTLSSEYELSINDNTENYFLIHSITSLLRVPCGCQRSLQSLLQAE
jgi:hypothetical protein